MSKRKYVKKSSYWEKFEKPLSELVEEQAAAQSINIEPASAGDSYYVSSASCPRRDHGGTSTQRRRNRISVSAKNDKFSNIRSGLLPYQVSAEGVDVRETIELCQKAYANIAIFRNAIDIMAELANSPIYVTEGNEASRIFTEKWFSKINLWGLKDQFFREYYRSGNVFTYRFDAILQNKDLKKNLID